MCKGVLRNLVLVLGLIFGFCVSFCFAEESITITTYYPSPYGVYNELQTNKLAVGDTDGSGGLNAGDQPNRDGDIRLRAQEGDPTTWPAGTIGQFAYSGANDELYHYNGTMWVAQGAASVKMRLDRRGRYDRQLRTPSMPTGLERGRQWMRRGELHGSASCGFRHRAQLRGILRAVVRA